MIHQISQTRGNFNSLASRKCSLRPLHNNKKKNRFRHITDFFFYRFCRFLESVPLLTQFALHIITIPPEVNEWEMTQQHRHVFVALNTFRINSGGMIWTHSYVHPAALYWAGTERHTLLCEIIEVISVLQSKTGTTLVVSCTKIHQPPSAALQQRRSITRQCLRTSARLEWNKNIEASDWELWRHADREITFALGKFKQQ